MKKTLLSLLGAMMLLLPSAIAEEVQRVLMIGNSYTFYNNLPQVLMALSQKTNHPLHVESYTVGAMSLRSFLDDPNHAKAKQMLAKGQYDWVILQDQSMTPAYKPSETMNSVQRWAQLAKKNDTKVLLFLTWAHAAQAGGKVTPQADMQEKTSTTYCRAAVENKVRVAPVGEAWARWYRQSGKTLHDRDGSHPNAMGSYLAACVLHGAISRKAVKNIPATLKQGRSMVLRIPANMASDLQKTANATLKNFSPKKYLEKQEERDAQRPTADEIKAQLHKGMKIDELLELTGKPIFKSSQNGQISYQFNLRGGVEFCAYCTPQGIIRNVSIAVPGRMVDIIDLNAL